jgi:lipoate-protein ligase A
MLAPPGGALLDRGPATAHPPPSVDAAARAALSIPLGRARWRLLTTRPLPGAENMALDEALMERARATGECVLRVYAWSAPTLSLGRNQRARGEYDTGRAAELGVTFVRRPTGGRAVLHFREVTYSVTAPAAALGDLAAAYAAINTLLVAGLRVLGVEARVAQPTSRALRPGPLPCFEAPAAGEIVAGGRKLVGSAQWRDRGAILQHGSILVEDDQSLAAALLRRPTAAPPRAATLAALLGRAPAHDEVAAALARSLAERAEAVCQRA